ncbi:MAG TPA: YidB family protein, partial [Beijerinckiaceae bacterium]
GLGGLLSGGLKDLVDRFDKAGERETAQSWVSAGENKPCNAESLRRALGPETLADLREHTGLSDEELVSRLCRTLPEAVDRYTPEGRLP